MLLNQIRPKVKQAKKIRVGRGGSSGLGKQSGRGDKGTNARSGRKSYIGFIGGQTRLARRLPKFGFNVYKRRVFQIVNLFDINKRINKEITNINPQILRDNGLIKSAKKPVKILGDGEIKRSLNFQGCVFSASALKKIKDIGGKIAN